jgi:hypothetical protein
MKGANSALLDGAVHALELPIRPQMVGLGGSVLDIVLNAGPLKGMAKENHHARRQSGLDERHAG